MSGWILFATALAAVIIVSKLVIRRESHALVGVFERLRSVYGGNVTPGNLLYYPRLEFGYRGIAMAASAMPTTARQTFTAGGAVPAGGGGARSFVDFRFPCAEEWEVKVRPMTLKSKMDNALVKNRLRSGDPAFDEAFLIHGKPADRVRMLLGDALRTALLAGAQRGMTMQVGRGRCTVSMPGLGMEQGAYERLIAVSMLLCDQLLKLATGGAVPPQAGSESNTGAGLRRGRLEFIVPGLAPRHAGIRYGIGRGNGG